MASNFYCNESRTYGKDSVVLMSTGLLIIDGNNSGTFKQVLIRQTSDRSLSSVFLEDKYGKKNGVVQSNYKLYSDL